MKVEGNLFAGIGIFAMVYLAGVTSVSGGILGGIIGNRRRNFNIRDGSRAALSKCCGTSEA